jgi:mRNA interferase RelE/StbE
LTYELVFDKQARDDLEELPRHIQERIFSKLLQAKIAPARFFEGLVERKEQKIRVGDYTVLAYIDHSEKRILLLRIGHRKNIYGR